MHNSMKFAKSSIDITPLLALVDNMTFQLPELSYDYDALEPHIDTLTMEIHHSKHHAGYTSKLNNAISGTEMEENQLKTCLSIIMTTLPCGTMEVDIGITNFSGALCVQVVMGHQILIC